MIIKHPFISSYQGIYEFFSIFNEFELPFEKSRHNDNQRDNWGNESSFKNLSNFNKFILGIKNHNLRDLAGSHQILIECIIYNKHDISIICDKFCLGAYGDSSNSRGDTCSIVEDILLDCYMRARIN